MQMLCTMFCLGVTVGGHVNTLAWYEYDTLLLGKQWSLLHFVLSYAEVPR